MSLAVWTCLICFANADVHFEGNGSLQFPYHWWFTNDVGFKTAEGQRYQEFGGPPVTAGPNGMSTSEIRQKKFEVFDEFENNAGQGGGSDTIFHRMHWVSLTKIIVETNGQPTSSTFSITETLIKTRPKPNNAIWDAQSEETEIQIFHPTTQVQKSMIGSTSMTAGWVSGNDSFESTLSANCNYSYSHGGDWSLDRLYVLDEVVQDRSYECGGLPPHTMTAPSQTCPGRLASYYALSGAGSLILGLEIPNEVLTPWSSGPGGELTKPNETGF